MDRCPGAVRCGGTRPCLVIGTNVINDYRRTVVVIQLSSSPQASPPLLIPIVCAGPKAGRRSGSDGGGREWTPANSRIGMRRTVPALCWLPETKKESRHHGLFDEADRVVYLKSFIPSNQICAAIKSTRFSSASAPSRRSAPLI